MVRRLHCERAACRTRTYRCRRHVYLGYGHLRGRSRCRTPDGRGHRLVDGRQEARHLLRIARGGPALWCPIPPPGEVLTRQVPDHQQLDNQTRAGWRGAREACAKQTVGRVCRLLSPRREWTVPLCCQRCDLEDRVCVRWPGGGSGNPLTRSLPSRAARGTSGCSPLRNPRVGLRERQRGLSEAR